MLTGPSRRFLNAERESDVEGQHDVAARMEIGVRATRGLERVELAVEPRAHVQTVAEAVIQGDAGPGGRARTVRARRRAVEDAISLEEQAHAGAPAEMKAAEPHAAREVQ